MSVTRRNLLGSGAALGLLSCLLPTEQMQALQQISQSDTSGEELPHSSTRFWTGFYDSVNPASPNKGEARGPGDLADPGLETQYLHYLSDQKRLRYATSIEKQELLDHDGDVSVSILMNQFHPSTADARRRNASQLRIDTTQNHAFMNILAPLAWTAMASLQPDKAGKLPSLDQLHFKSDQVMNASSHILLTQGNGKMAVNISQAPKDSFFVKALSAMIQGAKMVAPLVTLPAVSVPAMSAFSEAFSYWENRTQFLINGNLVDVVATQQAADDPEVKSPSIGLVPGDYVVVAKKDTEALQPVLSKLHVFQGYLVHKDTDLNQPLEKVTSDSRIPDISYATVRVGITPSNTSLGVTSKAEKAEDDTGASGSGGASPSKTKAAKKP